MIGTYALSAGYYDAYYAQAQQVRTLIIRDFAAAFEQCDVLVGPMCPTTAFALGDKTSDPLAMYLNDVYTIPASLAGTPALTPAGRARRTGPARRPAGDRPAAGGGSDVARRRAVEAAVGFDATPTGHNALPAPGSAAR